MKYQVIFSLKKNNEKVFINVVFCSRDWRFKVKRRSLLRRLAKKKKKKKKKNGNFVYIESVPRFPVLI